MNEELENALLRAMIVREYVSLYPPISIDKEKIEKAAALHYHNDGYFQARVGKLVEELAALVGECLGENEDEGQ